MATEPASVRLRAVSKSYGRRRQVLSNVDLQVPPGDILALIGRNGSGKSTLLKVMVGLSRPSSGTVSRNARVVSYVPETFASHDRMSASAYLRHMGMIRGLTARAATQRSHELLERLTLTGGADTPVRRLSKGNAQKVALAQALLVPPQLLALDEPWSGLDSASHGTLSELIAEAAQQGGAVVFTDHDDSVVRSAATRVCEISRGRLRSMTVPDHIAQQPAVTHVEFVAPPGRHPADVHWSAQQGVLRVRQQGGTVGLLLHADCLDAVLLTALSRGWSVASVGPATGDEWVDVGRPESD